jgi:beta-mannosidase
MHLARELTITQNKVDHATTAPVWGPWSCSAHPPGTVIQPDQLAGTSAEWIPAIVPGTVASALHARGSWSFDEPTDIDVCDWWFRSCFYGATTDHQADLCFDGLATLAEVWLNGQRILSTDNMFRAYRVSVSNVLRDENELAIRFRSLSEDLKVKRPRPKWKTNLVDHQQLRWQRTSLQGRIPGWSPTAPAIGPWREIRIESASVTLEAVHVVTRLEGTAGIVTVCARILTTGASPTNFVAATMLQVGTEEVALELHADPTGYVVRGELRIENPDLWWPHTHGQPAMHACEIRVVANGSIYSFPQSDIGFRTLKTHGGDSFGLQINGQPVYCRGACWTVSDVLSLTGTFESLRHDLRLARDAGVNMLRVGGTMVYESDRFYQLCDELGILVWQDFMFANMDYPVADESFHQNIVAEATQQLQRLAAHPCVAIYCGNSEIEQQAAFLGVPRDLWRNNWFGEELLALCTVNHPGTSYVPSTPSGGLLPFHTSTGLTHYYGIGAYLRSPTELRQANVQFTPECLGFANVPDPATIDLVTGGALPVMHSPNWKRRVPRDSGAGWDFDDVRDHYLRERYGVDPVQIRSWDMPRYLQLSRLVTGEMMSLAFSEWRGCHSENQGALVWFYKDLWPGAGLGIVDATGLPKAAYYYCKRAWANRQVTITDEGLNGLHLHLINETAGSCDGTLQVVLLKEPNIVVARQEIPVKLDPRSRQWHSAEQILGSFYDVSYAYRFGPPQHDVVIATWYDAQRNVIGEAYHFIRRRDPGTTPAAIEASANQIDETEYHVTLQTDSFLHGVTLNAKGFLPSDNYFHLPPGRTKTVVFQARGTATPPTFKVDVEALNLATPLRVITMKAN